jgi:hypothetical protein
MVYFSVKKQGKWKKTKGDAREISIFKFRVASNDIYRGFGQRHASYHPQATFEALKTG